MSCSRVHWRIARPPAAPTCAPWPLLGIVLAATLGPGLGCRPRAAPVAAPTAPALPAQNGAPAAALPFVDAETLLAEAAPLWDARDEQDKLRGCIDRLEQAYVQRPNDAALAARLARAQFLLGHGHLRLAHDLPGMKRAFARGMLVGEQALRLASAPFRTAMDEGGNVEDALGAVDTPALDALTWYVANLGGFAAAKGSTTALFYAERLRCGIERLLALDEQYFYATPHRFMGIFLANVPAFAGGSLKRARLHFERALTLSPHYFDNALAYAGAYAAAKHDRALYRQLVAQVAAGDPKALPDVAAELRLQQRQAQAVPGVPPPKEPARERP